MDKDEIEGMLCAIEYEKSTLKGQRETLKKNTDKVQNERKKIELQKRELGNNIYSFFKVCIFFRKMSNFLFSKHSGETV